MARQSRNRPDRDLGEVERMVVIALTNVITVAVMRYATGESEIVAATAIVLAMFALTALLFRLRAR